ncbi:MAG: hypothetical protein ACRDO4_08230, partial [Nocardioides sp.]
LEAVAELRASAERLPPDEAAETRAGADERERRAQADWRTAVAGYEQRRWPSDVPDQPVVTHPPIGSEPASTPSVASAATESSSPTAEPPPDPADHDRPERPAVSAELVEPPLRSALIPEAELVTDEPHDAIVWPPGWRRRSVGGAVVATGPPRPDGARPARLEWRRGAPSPEVEDAVVEDEDRYNLAGHEVSYRRLGHRADGVELVSEEWRWQVGDEVLVLTGTVPRADYLTVCDLFEEVAAGVDPTGAGSY